LVVAFVIALSSGSEGGAVLVVLIGIVAFVVLSGPDRRKGGDGLEILGTGSGRTLSETERLRLLKEKTLEFRVEGEPARILDMVRGYFESEEWPHREISRFRSSLFGTHTRVTCILDRGATP
jgi:hypothetical protein